MPIETRASYHDIPTKLVKMEEHPPSVGEVLWAPEILPSFCGVTTGRLIPGHGPHVCVSSAVLAPPLERTGTPNPKKNGLTTCGIPM